MSSSVIQFRVDDDIKKAFVEIYEKLGLDLPSALRMFMKRSVMVKGVPFDMVLSNEENIEEALDFADRVAENTALRYSHEDIFSKARKHIDDYK